jgi:hypothetical protein
MCNNPILKKITNVEPTGSTFELRSLTNERQGPWNVAPTFSLRHQIAGKGYLMKRDNRIRNNPKVKKITNMEPMGCKIGMPLIGSRQRTMKLLAILASKIFPPRDSIQFMCKT